jgi:MFS family permease
MATAPAEQVGARAARPFDRRFALVVAVGFAYFTGLGVLAPVLPRYVEDELGGGGAQVGIAVGAFAVSAALLRAWVGRLGDREGRRLLVVAGCIAAGVSIVGYGLPGGLAVLVLMRLVTGVGEAAAFVGAATAAQDLAPDERRGQAASLFSIAVYGGLGLGPPVGEWVYRAEGAGASWVVAAGCCLLASALALAMPNDRAAARAAAAPRMAAARGWRASLHAAGLRPGVILLLGASGYAGFASFVPLYVDDIGVDDASPAFVEYALIVLAVRIVGSRLPDLLGPRRGPLAALTLQATGLLTMGLWASPLGLYTSTAVYAAGVSLLYPALFPVVVDAAPPEERSHAIATFTLGFDLSQGLGAPLLGAVVALTSERGAFIAAGLLSALGYLLHRSTPVPARARVATA